MLQNSVRMTPLLSYFSVSLGRRKISNRATCPATAGSPTQRDVPYDIGECVIHSSFPPAPPPRALELVKEEVHRALEAFSTRPLKGETSARCPADLLRPFDVSRDGRVTYHEFQAGMLGLGIALTNHEAGALARAVDREDSGLVDRGRFEAAATQDWGQGGGECEEATSAPERFEGESEAFGNDDARPLPGACENRKSVLSCPEEQQQQAGSRNGTNDASCARIGDNQYADGEERIAPPPPPPRSESPNLVRQASTSELATTSSRVRSPPTVSFDHWQRHRTTIRGAGSEDNEVTAPVATALSATRDGSRKNSSNSDHCETANKSNSGSSSSDNNNNNKDDKRPLPQKRVNSLNTLRSLLRQDGVFDYADTANNGDYRRHSSFDSGSGGWERRGRRPQQQEQSHSRRLHEDQRGLRTARGGDGGGGELRRNSGNVEHRHPRDESAPAFGSSYAGPKRGHVGFNRGGRRQSKDGTGGGHAVAEAQNLERRRQAIATRAESILRLRSRGDLVGLRRAMSKADPSASGVVSQREMEQVVLRRFGTGLGNDEASELAARYRKEFNGRSMVDYDRLFDSLDAKEAGLFDQAVAPSSSTPPYSGHGCERGRGRGRGGGQRQPQQRLLSRDSSGTDKRRPASTAAVAGSRRRGSSLAPPAAGARTRYRQRRCNRRGVPKCNAPAEELAGGTVPAEDSQLVRRARAKTLALLDRHGTRSVDCVFGLVDPGVMRCLDQHRSSKSELRLCFVA